MDFGRPAGSLNSFNSFDCCRSSNLHLLLSSYMCDVKIESAEGRIENN